MIGLSTSLTSVEEPATKAGPTRGMPARWRLLPIVAFVLGHVVLARVMHAVPSIAVIHALGCVGVGLAIAATRPLHNVAYVVSYIAGSEVLWRMSRAGLFWEYGKYAVALVIVVALMRMQLRRNRVIALVYFGLLLPSALLTLVALDLDVARKQLSFNLSGPLALTLCVLFFSNVRLTANQVKLTFFALIGPVMGIAAIAYFSTVTTLDLEFTGQSNATTSGGFGPNQVSAMLGLGCMFSLLMLFERRSQWRLRIPLIGIALVLATQAALTFSRGGLVLAFAGAFAASIYLLRDRRARVTLLLLGTLFFAVANYIVVPRLDAFTGGKLAERYANLNSTNRGILADYDLQLFRDNPFIGVGPGVAASKRIEIGFVSAAHTEYTRLLAEHGVLGATAILMLIILSARTIRGARTSSSRAFVLAMVVWTALFLAVNAMRLVAPAFLLGLACSIAYSSTGPMIREKLGRRRTGPQAHGAPTVVGHSEVPA